MSVKTAFGQTGGAQDVADRGVVIAFDRKELQGFFDNFETGLNTFVRHDYSKAQSKESRPIVDPALVCGEGPGFGFPPGRGLSMTRLCSTYFWSIGVMEYWKNENPTPIFCNLEQKPSRSSDA
jgi:hypothetical protein